VGRTANAGLSFVGKLFLLTGLFCAIGYNFTSPVIDLGSDLSAQYQKGSYKWTAGKETGTADVPPAIVLAPLVLGSVFLVLARRRDGGAHVFRGFAGCAVGIVAAIFAVGPAKAAIPIFLTEQNWGALREGDMTGQLIATGVLLMLSLGLLFWPKAGHSRKIYV